jgi:hypothetical protein
MSELPSASEVQPNKDGDHRGDDNEDNSDNDDNDGNKQ